MWVEWQNVVAALPLMVRAIVTAAKEMGPQDLASPVVLKPETVALICEAKLALEGKLSNASLQPAASVATGHVGRIPSPSPLDAAGF